MARINSKRVKIGGMSQLMIDLKPRRCDADVFINTPIDVTNLVDYVNKRKKDKIMNNFGNNSIPGGESMFNPNPFGGVNNPFAGGNPFGNQNPFETSGIF